MVDAYALIKVLTSLDGASPQIGVLVNDARDIAEADLVFRQLDVAATRFLHRTLHSFGFVATDPALRDAVMHQRAVVEHAPQSAASRCFRILATRVSALAPLGGPGLRLVARPATASARFSKVEAPQCA